MDVTLVSQHMAGRVVYWKVLPDIIDSDHRLMTYEITAERQRRRGTIQDGPRRYLAKKADWIGFRRALLSEKESREMYLACENVNVSAVALTQAITSACEAYMPVIRPGSTKEPGLVDGTIEQPPPRSAESETSLAADSGRAG